MIQNSLNGLRFLLLQSINVSTDKRKDNKMKVKELIEILKNVDKNFEVKITDMEGNVDEDIQVVDHDFETVYLVAEYL